MRPLESASPHDSIYEIYRKSENFPPIFSSVMRSYRLVGDGA
jgi:hypothetical protein